ncbi:MAG: hypothetical protein MR414_06080 [Bacteroidales bacterium]|nr:hypothetical protein [Bacteroidales bacterium]
MNKDWTDIIRESALDEDVRLPQDDFDILQSKYAAHRRRRARTGALCLGSFAAACLGIALVLLRPGIEVTQKPVVAQKLASDACEKQETGREFIELRQHEVAAGSIEVAAVGAEVTETAVVMGDASTTDTAVVTDAEVVRDSAASKVSGSTQQEFSTHKFEPEEAVIGLDEAGNLLADAGLELEKEEKHRGRVSVAVSGSLSNTLRQNQPVAGTGQVVELKNAIKRFELPEKGKEEPISYSHFPMPLEFAVTVKWDALDWLSLVGGVQYSLLTSNCGLPNRRFAQQNVSYLGLPVAVNLVGRTSFGLSYYLSGGALVEKCIYAHRGTERLRENGLQYALTAGAGLQYDFTRVLGIFLEPQLDYYLSKSAFETRRSSGPLSFGMSMGLRFNL